MTDTEFLMAELEYWRNEAFGYFILYKARMKELKKRLVVSELLEEK